MFNNHFFKTFILVLFVGGIVFLQAPVATEANPVLGNTFNSIVVTTTADVINPADGVCSLREAIISANINPFSGSDVEGECQKGSNTMTDRIYLLSGESYFLTLVGPSNSSSKTGSLYLINNTAKLDIEIVVSGDETNRPIIDAAGLGDQAVEIGDAFFAMSNISIQNGKGGIRNVIGTVDLFDVEIKNMKADAGAGIFNTGYLSLTDSYIQENESAVGNGGGIYNGPSGVMNIITSHIESNKANRGGGIYNRGEINFENLSSISNNVAAVGGGLYNLGTTTFDGYDTVFGSNHASFGGGLYNAGGVISGLGTVINDNDALLPGGGIMNTDGGEIDLERLTLRNNESDDLGSGIYNDVDSHFELNSGFIYNHPSNSAVYNKGNLELSDTRIFNNVGGGIVSEGGSIILRRTQVYDNNNQTGGGVHLKTGAQATIHQSAIYRNRATTVGGGIYVTGSSLEMVNTTVSGNATELGIGGGIHLHSGFEGEVIRFYNVTVADNSAKSKKGSALSFVAKNIDIEMVNTILTGSEDQTVCQNGTVKSKGNNIVSDDSCLAVLESGDQITAPLLRPFGSIAETVGHMPELDSPAYGNGNSDVCAASPVSGIDQRGLAREYGCDIGAIELLQAPPPATEMPAPSETPITTATPKPGETPVATATPKPGETPVATATAKPGETPEPGTGESTYLLFLPLVVKN